jgi:hypothetical protein
MTVYEKYQALSRDAMAAGDRIAGENYLQHAEHYFRLMQVAKQSAQQQGNGQERQADQRPRKGQSDQQPSEEVAENVAGEEAAAAASTDDRSEEPDSTTEKAADDTPSPQLDDSIPMSPAALVAEVEAKAEGNGKDEAPQKRTPRRRRRAAQNTEAAPDAAAKENADPASDDSESATA